MTQTEKLLQALRIVHAGIRDAVVSSCTSTDSDVLAGVAEDADGDTKYEIDRIAEESLVDVFEKELAPFGTFVLIAEGLKHGKVVLPHGRSETDAAWRVIVDPIDGTRGLMYQKRSAWILTGVAPNRGAATNLQDIQIAVQTEIPLVKQHLCDVVWAMQDGTVSAERLNRLTGERSDLCLRPSRARTIRGGFAMISRFFPGARGEMAQIDDEIVERALGPIEFGKAHCFEDQYVSSAGQLFELMAGHDRFVADLRPLMEPILARRGLALGLCCHPYDICTELIARNLGVIVTDVRGGLLDSPLAIEPNVAWAGYANQHIRREIEPLLQQVLREHGILNS